MFCCVLRRAAAWVLPLAAALGSSAPGEVRELSLAECQREAAANNRQRKASDFGVALAEAQHRQALAAYWPQAEFRGGVTRLDEPVNFLFPAGAIGVPPQTVQVPATTALVTVPANAFGPGFPPVTLQLPVSAPAQSLQTGAQSFLVPPQDVRVTGRDNLTASLETKWLLWDGGMRAGYRQQALAGTAAARAAARRTALEVANSVERLYWGALLSRQLAGLGRETLARLEATLRLTETMYKESAGKVSRTDYLDNLVTVETVRGLTAQLEKNQASAEAALAYTMGLGWRESVRPADREIPFAPFAGGLDELVAAAYEFSPDWARLEAGLTAAEAALKTARSGYLPRLGLRGEVHGWNSVGAHAGMATPQNRAGWSIGLGVEMPVFDGLLTAGKVQEARARLAQLKESRFLLREGLGLRIRDLALGLAAAGRSCRAAQEASRAAVENRELNLRAYQAELVETEKVIRAQLQAALMEAQQAKCRYDHAALLAELSLVVGGEVQRQASGGTVAAP